MWFSRFLAGACLVGALAACAAVDPVDSRYDTIGRSLAKARNEAIFLNLVRASHDYPLSFATISNVSPSLSNTSSFALPSFLLGPSPRGVEPSFTPGRDAVFSTPASNSTAISTNFNVSTQETSAFYDGFLKPIDLTVLDYFLRQGYPRELLFWLFTESVVFDLPNGGKKLYFSYNPPLDFGCPEADQKRRCFREYVLLAVISGLTVEGKVRTKELTQSGNSGQSGSIKSVIGIPFHQFCFDQRLGQAAARQMDDKLVKDLTTKYIDVPFRELKPQCGATWEPALPQEGILQSDTLDIPEKAVPGQIRFRIRARSAYGIFQFLGKFMKWQRGDAPPPLKEPRVPTPDEKEQPVLQSVRGDQDILKVAVNSGGNCFVQTKFLDGDYCVPENATNTKRIISLLAQLIAIQTSATDLTYVPSVRIVQ